MVLAKIKQELEILVISAEKPEDDSNKNEQPKKKLKFLADEVDESDMPLSVTEEFDRYLEEKALKPDDNPLLWWRMKSEIYPNVAKLARKYLCVQGSSTPAKRVMSDMGSVLTKKRLAMSDELFSKIMYLGDCI